MVDHLIVRFVNVTLYRMVYRCIDYTASTPNDKNIETATLFLMEFSQASCQPLSIRMVVLLYIWPPSLNNGVLHYQTSYLNKTEIMQVIKKLI